MLFLIKLNEEGFFNVNMIKIIVIIFKPSFSFFSLKLNGDLMTKQLLNIMDL